MNTPKNPKWYLRLEPNENTISLRKEPGMVVYGPFSFDQLFTAWQKLSKETGAAYSAFSKD